MVKQLTSGIVPSTMTGDELLEIGRVMGMHEQDAVKWARASGYTFNGTTDMWSYVGVKTTLPSLTSKNPDTLSSYVQDLYGGSPGGGYSYYNSGESSSYTGRTTSSSSVNSLAAGVMNLRLATG
jgi:hypothetical protein